MVQKKAMYKDVVKTIGEDEEVSDYSEESDEELEFQPTKQKSRKNTDFDTGFDFLTSVEEYNEDKWNDLSKYVKRKAKYKTDDKISKVRQKRSLEEQDKIEDESPAKEQIYLSDDELKHDKIKVKQKKIKKQKETEADIFFEDVDIDTKDASFYQMNLSRPLLKAISQMKFVHPTTIQAATIPIALEGRDICGCAATGTGKTAAYMLPTLERLLYRPSSGIPVTRVLVLVPTRELGVQVYQVTKQLCQFTDIQIGLAVGGLDLKTQETVLRKNPDIVIATPGRLIDHLKSTPSFNLDAVEVLILDEADRMLDEYFAEQMNEIIKQCSRTRQTMLFSATMSEEVENLAAVSLSKPIRLFVDSNKNVAYNLRQEFIRIRAERESDREPILAALVCRVFKEHCMVFVQTKKQAHRLHIMLGLLGLKVAELHGNLSQPQRLEALERFKTKTVDILVATDVAARGLDIPGVQTVINFVMPVTIEHYIHRVGRTARAGRAGVSVSLAGESERKIVKEVIKNARNPVKNRIIPPDVLEKYRNKLEKLEPEIAEILQEEYNERQLSKVENQVNRAEKLLKGEAEEKRPWFQTKKQRQEEKNRLDSTFQKNKSDKKEKTKFKGKSKEAPNDKVSDELSKVALAQARLAKRKHKPKRINTVREETTTFGGKLGKKQKSFFGEKNDNTKIRTIKKSSNFKSKAKFKSGAKNKKGGKTFGRPQQKKNR
ncbi:unnamed protein product [Callosobruchus maculatus]|uniref:RNA helicase n=2 Tax=Callosobruchus maculatus TaxID=64391 RepID=A0A653DCR7_CALMS|nr:unnamed protein product [Callosobruchus maculatus]